MAGSQFNELLIELYERTDARRVQWEETADRHAFRVAVGKGHVRVEERKDENGYWYHVATLIDSLGRDVISATEIAASDSPAQCPSMAELFQAAKASALNADELLGDMLGALRKT